MKKILDEHDYAKPWVPPLVSGRLKSFLYVNGRMEKYKKGETIVSEDDYLQDIFILKSGVLSNSIIQHELNKSFIMCGIRIPGHISGYTTFLLRDPAPVRISTLTNTEICRVSFAEMDAYLDAHPDLKTEFMRLCARCLRSEIDMMLAVGTLPAEDRFWRLMAAIISTITSSADIAEAAQKGEWLALPFKINREAMAALLYVSLMTIDRMYAAFIKNGFLKRTQSGYMLNAKNVAEGMEWIEDRYIINH